jgi:putative transposase
MGNFNDFSVHIYGITYKYNNIKEARQAIHNYIRAYNYERCHSAIGNIPPAEAYLPAILLEAAKAAA